MQGRMFVVVAVVVAAVLGGGITYAAIPDPTDNQIKLCYKAADAAKAGGASLTVIDPAAGGSCKGGQATASVTDQELVTGVSAGPQSIGFTFDSDGGHAVTVTTTRPTKLLALGHVEMQVVCENTALPCQLVAGMALNGVPLDLTVRTGLGTNSPYESSAFQIVEVPAGTHTLTWRFKSNNTDNIYTGSGSTVALVKLGG